MEKNVPEEIIDKVAELFDYSPYLFATIVRRDDELAAAIMSHDMPFYEEKIAEFKNVPEQDRNKHRLMLAKLILKKEANKLSNMTEEMLRLYYTH